MKDKIYMVSLGCSKNLIDSEIMAGLIENANLNLVNDIDDAEIIIVNTCSFINDAKEESINTILECAMLKKEHNCKYLIVTGCLSERYKSELINEIPEIDALIGTGNIDEIVEVINKLKSKQKIIRVGNINNTFSNIDNTMRVQSTPPHMAYVKIAEGCDNFCTYCIIPKLRGKFRSRSMESILEEVNYLVKNGVREIILIAQDTSKYGLDLYGEFKLPELLDKLNDIKNLKWIRVLYIYPETFNQKLIDSIKKNDKVLKYVDIPIQHINNHILKMMNRKTTKEEIESIINKLRNEIPDVIIRTTLIVGFPGEDENHFEELYQFVKKVKFDRLGVFSYSQEEDTAAASLPDQVDDSVKKQRSDKIMSLQRDISYDLNEKKVGKIYDVIIEEKVDENLFFGRTYMDSPEIDCGVYINSKNELEIGDLFQVKITEFLEYDLRGELANESSE